MAGDINCNESLNCTASDRYYTVTHASRSYTCLQEYDESTCAEPWCMNLSTNDVEVVFPGMC